MPVLRRQADALIRDYVAEHERIVDAGDGTLRALDRCDVHGARTGLFHRQEILTTHWAGEEAGVFSVMSEADAPYAEYVDVLVDEHRSLAAFLDVFDVALPADRERLRSEVDHRRGSWSRLQLHASVARQPRGDLPSPQPGRPGLHRS